jgi:hypothetical protein
MQMIVRREYGIGRRGEIGVRTILGVSVVSEMNDRPCRRARSGNHEMIAWPCLINRNNRSTRNERNIRQGVASWNIHMLMTHVFPVPGTLNVCIRIKGCMADLFSGDHCAKNVYKLRKINQYIPHSMSWPTSSQMIRLLGIYRDSVNVLLSGW